MDRLTLIQITGIVSMAVCFAGALAHRLHCRQNRARKLLAFPLFMWAIAYLFRLLSFDGSGVTPFGVMTVATLVVGYFYIRLTMLYPIEVSRPELHREKHYFAPSFHLAAIGPLDTDQLARLFNLSYGEPFGGRSRRCFDQDQGMTPEAYRSFYQKKRP